MSGSKKNINDQIAALRTLLGKNDDDDALSFLQNDDQHHTENGNTQTDAKEFAQDNFVQNNKEPFTIEADQKAVNDSMRTIDSAAVQLTTEPATSEIDPSLQTDPALDSALYSKSVALEQLEEPQLNDVSSDLNNVGESLESFDSEDLNSDTLGSDSASAIPKAVKTFKPVDFLHFKKHSNDQALLLIKRFLSKHGKPEQNSTELQALKSAIDRIIAKPSKDST